MAAVPRLHHGHPGAQDLHGRVARRRLRPRQGHDPRRRPGGALMKINTK